MKIQIKILLVFLFVCFLSTLHAQEKPDITGVWTGQIYNDSTRSYLPFELAISRKNGEFSGYSYTVFVIDSIENIGVKEVNISDKDGVVKVRDKKLIDDNYRELPDKGVYTTIELSYSENDTADILSGKWYTNKTRHFYPLSGTAFLSRKKAYRQTRIMQRLAYLGLDKRLSFWSPSSVSYAPEKSVNKSASEKTDTADGDGNDKMITIQEPEFVIELPKKDTSSKIKLPEVTEVANILAALDSSSSKQTPPSETITPRVAKPTATNKTMASVVSAETALERPSRQSEETGRPLMAQNVKSSIETVQKNIPQAPDLSKRKIETIQSVEIRNDSIVLSLFDNGTVDGDTVSVILNGKVVISRVGLLATAYNETIHLTPDMGDSIKVVLYAENLGSIPPNTGLLVVRDGDANHEIRFSGDLKQNSAIILLRNKKQ